MADLHYFLLEKDHASGGLVVTEFYEKSEADVALHERESARAPDVEVVLFMSRSLDDLKRTHSRFFKTLGERVGELEVAAGGLLDSCPGAAQSQSLRRDRQAYRWPAQPRVP